MSTFFEPGTEYIGEDPYRAPEIQPEFQCVAVAVHPKDGTLRAFGFERSGSHSAWRSSAMRVREWADGWTVK